MNVSADGLWLRRSVAGATVSLYCSGLIDVKESQNQLNATYVIIVPLRPFVFLKLQAGLVHVLRNLTNPKL